MFQSCVLLAFKQELLYFWISQLNQIIVFIFAYLVEHKHVFSKTFMFAI